ncbi:MAG TPA: hypothetical protein DCS82_00975, partial [Rhodospirillaceae bacterium]|nr:hypothetical protein [Rhodospirillaceae bacterium]
HEVDFEDTILRDANLKNAKLETVLGLQSHQLGGADLSNAKVPSHIDEFEGIGQVEELSKHARNIFLSVVGGCVFSWLTIATTTDIALITNATSGGTKLPVINTSVPIAGFFWAAPVILLALYIYLNLYLQRLWEGMASLPAIFPDGRTLDERTHPWLLSGIVRVHVPRLANRPLAQTYLQFWISVIAAWGMVPFTIAMFAWRYLPKHDWIGSIWLFALLTGAMSYGLYTYRLARSTLKGNLSLRAEPEPIPTQKRAWDGFKRLQFNSVITCLAIFALAWTTFAIEVGKIGPERIVVLSSNIYWKLPIEFGHAQMQDADLKNADLSSVDLRRGLLMDANLEKANLSIGDLRETFFTRANLKRANLKFADLRNAFLYDANLEKANLRGAKLGGARLKDANFTGARLKEADLRKSYVTQAQLDTACGDAKTKLPPGLTLKSCKQKPSNR